MAADLPVAFAATFASTLRAVLAGVLFSALTGAAFFAGGVAVACRDGFAVAWLAFVAATYHPFRYCGLL